MHFGTYGKAHDADKVESLAVLFFFFPYRAAVSQARA